MHCLLESESQNHICAAGNCGLNDNGNDNGRNLPHFVPERVLDLYNTRQSQHAITQELGTGGKFKRNTECK